MKKLMTLLVIAGAFTIQSTKAQTASPDTATLNFVTAATKGGLKEVKTGKLAVSKGKSPSVKAFGAKMVTDHTKANSKLKMIVVSKGWKIPAPAAADVAPDAMLTGSTGADFDKNYVAMMVQDHKKTIAIFERGAKSPDAKIKAFATSTLPILKQHLARIQAIATKMGITNQ
jgi:putative membrane protein